MRALYMELKRAHGNYYTVEQFLAAGLGKEFRTIDLRGDREAAMHLELLQHSTTHAAYMNCAANARAACTTLSPNAVFNFMGRYSESSYNMYVDYQDGISLVDAVPQNPNIVARSVADSVMNPVDPEWTRASGDDLGSHPRGWGNRSLWVDGKVVDDLLRGALWTYGQPGQNYFYVLSLDLSKALDQYTLAKP